MGSPLAKVKTKAEQVSLETFFMRSLSVSQVELLKALYVKYDTPVDAFVSKWDYLVQLTSEFNRQVGGTFKPDELLHYMMNARKGSRWPRIRRQYRVRSGKRAS